MPDYVSPNSGYPFCFPLAFFPFTHRLVLVEQTAFGPDGKTPLTIQFSCTNIKDRKCTTFWQIHRRFTKANMCGVSPISRWWRKNHPKKKATPTVFDTVLQTVKSEWTYIKSKIKKTIGISSIASFHDLPALSKFLIGKGPNPLGKQHDGMITFSSCSGGWKTRDVVPTSIKYSKSPKEHFLMLDDNHFGGEGFWGGGKKDFFEMHPWVLNMAAMIKKESAQKASSPVSANNWSQLEDLFDGMSAEELAIMAEERAQLDVQTNLGNVDVPTAEEILDGDEDELETDDDDDDDMDEALKRIWAAETSDLSIALAHLFSLIR